MMQRPGVTKMKGAQGARTAGTAGGQIPAHEATVKSERSSGLRDVYRILESLQELRLCPAGASDITPARPRPNSLASTRTLGASPSAANLRECAATLPPGSKRTSQFARFLGQSRSLVLHGEA